MTLLRLCGIFTILLGLAILAGQVYIVITVPQSERPMKNPEVLNMLPIAFIVVGWKWCCARSRPEIKVDPQTGILTDPQLTQFENDLSYGVSRASFYGFFFLILGFGLLIPVAASFLNANTRDEMIGSLICSGIGPFPLIAYGIYLLRARPKRPGPRPPR